MVSLPSTLRKLLHGGNLTWGHDLGELKMNVKWGKTYN
jgi:hypothetical protein